jgi:hypothetical protein
MALTAEDRAYIKMLLDTGIPCVTHHCHPDTDIPGVAEIINKTLDVAQRLRAGLEEAPEGKLGLSLLQEAVMLHPTLFPGNGQDPKTTNMENRQRLLAGMSHLMLAGIAMAAGNNVKIPSPVYGLYRRLHNHALTEWFVAKELHEHRGDPRKAPYDVFVNPPHLSQHHPLRKSLEPHFARSENAEDIARYRLKGFGLDDNALRGPLRSPQAHPPAARTSRPRTDFAPRRFEPELRGVVEPDQPASGSRPVFVQRAPRHQHFFQQPSGQEPVFVQQAPEQEPVLPRQDSVFFKQVSGPHGFAPPTTMEHPWYGLPLHMPQPRHSPRWPRRTLHRCPCKRRPGSSHRRPHSGRRPPHGRSCSRRCSRPGSLHRGCPRALRRRA